MTLLRFLRFQGIRKQRTSSDPFAFLTLLRFTEKASAAGKSGILEAFDGTTNYEKEKDITNIRLFFLNDYAGTHKTYWRGVANRIENPPVLRLIPVILGDHEAVLYVRKGLGDLTNFYQDPSHQLMPTDVIGFSRGAMEAVKFVNELSSTGVPLLSTKKTVNHTTTFSYVKPPIRYVGLISPVMGPVEAPGLWPRSLPAGVGWMSQALDNQPNNPFLPQNTISRAAGTGGINITYPDDHSQVGREPAALSEMIEEAKQAGAPVR